MVSVIAMALVLSVVTAHTQTTYTWTGAADGDWNNASNWNGSGVPVDVYPSTPGLSFANAGDKIVLGVAGAVSPLPTLNIPTLQGHFLYDKQTPQIDLLYGTLSFTLDAYQGAYWMRQGAEPRTVATVGDGDIANGTATLNVAGVRMINRDHGGTQNFTVNADGTLNLSSTQNLDFSYGTGRNATFTINGGSVTIAGAVVDLLLEPANYVDLTAVGSGFTAAFGGDLPDLAAVQVEIGTGLSFRSTTGLTPTATDNGDGTFTVAVAALSNSFLLIVR